MTPRWHGVSSNRHGARTGPSDHAPVRARDDGRVRVLRVRRDAWCRSCRSYIEDELNAGELGVGLTIVASSPSRRSRPTAHRPARRPVRPAAVMVGGALLAAVGGRIVGLHVRALAAARLARRDRASARQPVRRRGDADRRPVAAGHRRAESGELLLRRHVRRARHRSDHRRRRARQRRRLHPGVPVCRAVRRSPRRVLACFAPSPNPPRSITTTSQRPRPTAGDAVKDEAPAHPPRRRVPGLVLACDRRRVRGVRRRSCPSTPARSAWPGRVDCSPCTASSCLLVRLVGARMPERLGPRRAVTIGVSTIMISLLSSRCSRRRGRCGSRRLSSASAWRSTTRR